jgi:hypothetical protein
MSAAELKNASNIQIALLKQQFYVLDNVKVKPKHKHLSPFPELNLQRTKVV